MSKKVAPINLSNSYNSRALLLLEDKPNLLWWIKTFSIPDISISQDELELMHQNLKLEGTKVTYGPISVTCFIDEDYEVYKEAYQWLFGKVDLSSSDGTKRRYIVPPKYKTNGLIFVYDNSLKKQRLKFSLRGLQLESIDGGEITTQGTEERLVTLNLVYDNFELYDDANKKIE